jgi:hypothetical protein
LTGTGPGLARQESAGRVIGPFWNRTDPFLRFKPRPVANTNCVKQIPRFGALQQYSSERHAQAHIMNLKDGCNASNHNLNYQP